jgi:putative intracellular protease/amidase
MTDFYAQLERQLVDAGRRRAVQGRLRRAAIGRGRLVAAVCAAVAVLAAGGALVPGLRSGAGPAADRGTAQQPLPPAALPPPDLPSLHGIGVAVFNGTTASGIARSVADRLERRGATIFTVTNAADQTAAETIVSYTEGNEAPAREVAAVLGVDGVEPYQGIPPLPFHGSPVIVVAGRDRIAP